MTAERTFDRDLEGLARGGGARGFADLHTAVLDRVRGSRQRPGWFVSLRGRAFGDSATTLDRPRTRLAGRPGDPCPGPCGRRCRHRGRRLPIRPAQAGWEWCDRVFGERLLTTSRWSPTVWHFLSTRTGLISRSVMGPVQPSRGTGPFSPSTPAATIRPNSTSPDRMAPGRACYEASGNWNTHCRRRAHRSRGSSRSVPSHPLMGSRRSGRGMRSG